MSGVHAFVLTLNEAHHIVRCIKSVSDQCASITIIDSGSSDGTSDIARSLGAEVVNNPFVTHADQVNFATDALANRGGWLFRLDADEIVDADSRVSLVAAVRMAEAGIDGLLVNRRIHFMGQRMRRGGIEPSWQLRLWRNGAGRCEDRWMDEHVRVAGRVARSGIVASDINLGSLTWWTHKHNGYASREAIEVLDRRFGLLDRRISHENDRMDGQAGWRRWLKYNLYLRMPPGLRSVGYFLYRYVVRLGFLDGRRGFYFHLLQALWYRTLVDAKVEDILDHQCSTGDSLHASVAARTGIDLAAHSLNRENAPLPTRVAVTKGARSVSRDQRTPSG